MGVTSPRAEEYLERAIDDAIESREAIGPKPVSAWFAVLGPPIAGLMHLMISFTFSHVACNTRNKLMLHGLTIVLLAIVVAAGLTARRIWESHGAMPPSDDGGPIPRRRFMAILGMIGALVAALIIIGQWLPNVVIPVCIRT